jgi:hypothetical protein
MHKILTFQNYIICPFAFCSYEDPVAVNNYEHKTINSKNLYIGYYLEVCNVQSSIESPFYRATCLDDRMVKTCSPVN